MPSASSPSSSPATRTLGVGSFAAFGTYLMWGVFPLYWKQLAQVNSFEVLAHRIIWAALFTVAMLAISRRLEGLIAMLRQPRRIAAAAVASALITVNWGTYIWAVNNGHIIEGSLGYYINPLVSVALGAIFLRERIDRYTVAAVAIAGAGIVAATIMIGSPPWISLVLASSFGFYGLAKKRAGLDPMTGLAAETLCVLPLALAFLVHRQIIGAGAFGGEEVLPSILLVLAGPITAIPLLTFAFAANRITLQRLGFFQYLSPSLQLLLGLVVYRESVPRALMVAFAAVLVAVLIYAATRTVVAQARPAGVAADAANVAAAAGPPEAAGVDEALKR